MRRQVTVNSTYATNVSLSVDRRARLARAAAATLALGAWAAGSGNASGASTFSWANGSDSAWQTGTNWAPASVPGTGDVALFGAALPNGASSFPPGNAAFIDFTQPTNNGTANEAVGAIAIPALGQDNSIVSVDNANNGTVGTLTMNGATFGGVALGTFGAATFNNVVLADLSPVSGSKGGTIFSTVLAIGDTLDPNFNTSAGTLNLVLNQTSNTILIAPNSSTLSTKSNYGEELLVNANIQEAHPGSSITIDGGGTSATPATGASGGELVLTGHNDFTGGINIGQPDGTQGAVVEIGEQLQVGASDYEYGGTDALPSTGTILVNNNSQLLIGGSGTYSNSGQTLVLNGIGVFGTSGAIRTAKSVSGLGLDVNWMGNWQLNSGASDNSAVQFTTTNATGTISLFGTLSGHGLFQKQGAGDMDLEGPVTATGGTQIGNGTLTVFPGSNLPSGELSISQSSTNDPEVILNNGVSNTGSLSSGWAVPGKDFASSTGTITSLTQGIDINGGTLSVTQDFAANYGVDPGSLSAETSCYITGSGAFVLSAASSATLNFTSTMNYTPLGSSTSSFPSAPFAAYTGGTDIYGGTLTLSAANALDPTGAVTINGPNAALALGANQTVGAITAVQGSIIGSAPGNVITATSLTKTGSGSFIIGPAVQTIVGSLAVDGGTLTIAEGSGGGTLGAIHAPTSGTLGTSVVNGTVTLASTATLDLTTHAMVINYNGQAWANKNYEGIPSPIGELTFGKKTPTQSYPAGSITRYVQTASDGGNWDLPGITSSVAENDFTGTTAVGVIDQNDLFALQGNDYTAAHGGPGTWEGVPVTNDNNVLVRYTYYGDTNLDGHVDGTDVDNLIQGFEGFGDGWLYGDFNYDGIVNGQDVTELIIGFSGQKNPMGDGGITPGQAQFLLSLATGITPAQVAKFDAIVGVPEPTTIGLLGLAAIGLLGRRRR